MELMDHISKRFNKDLEDLRNSVLAMGGLVESQLEKSIEAVVSGNSELGLRVARDDYKVNSAEVNIDEECGRLLALRGPTASDLRLIMAVVKTITDLERVGDEAEKIGYLASRLANMDRPSDSYLDLKKLGANVRVMLQDGMDAFARQDTKAALDVIRSDEQVDEEYEALNKACVRDMMENPDDIERIMQVMWAARALERVGDHAKNICEYVVYMVHGKDVRHIHIDDVELEVTPTQRFDP
ncbi:MAG: phosphate signaling complex protein PhoU [Pseudomonadota bacterium]